MSHSLRSHQRPDVFPFPLLLRYIDGRRWILEGPFVYLDRHIFIPAGFETDFNSIPRGLWNILPPTEFGEASLIHDWLYVNNGVKRGKADRIYLEVLKLLNAARWKQQLMYRGVRWGGWLAWKRYRAAEAADKAREAAKEGR